MLNPFKLVGEMKKWYASRPEHIQKLVKWLELILVDDDLKKAWEEE